MKKFLVGAVVLCIAVVINGVILQKTDAQDEDEYEPPKKAFVRLICAVAAKTEDGVKRVELKVRTHGEGFDTIGNFPPYGVYFFGGDSLDIAQPCLDLGSKVPTCIDPRTGATADNVDFIAEFPNSQAGYDEYVKWSSRMADGKRSCTPEDVPGVDARPTPPESQPQTTTPRPAQSQTPPETPPPNDGGAGGATPDDNKSEKVGALADSKPTDIVDLTNDASDLFITLSVGGFDSIFVTFLDKITTNNPEVFLNKQPDEQQEILDDFIRSGQPATVVIGTVDGKPIEVDLRDMPLADTAKKPLDAVARQDIKGILEISSSLWFNSEETLISGAGPYPVPGGEQEKYLLSEEYKQKGYFSLPIVDPIGLSFEEYHQKRGEMLLLYESQFNTYIAPIATTDSGQSVSVILLGVKAPPPFNKSQENQQIVNWENIKFVTKPGARQMGIINDTPFVLHPDSQVSIKSLNALELSGGAIEIQRPNDPLDSSFIVETPLGAVQSNKTRFWVAYNPARGYALVGVWEGAVSVTHSYTGKTMTLEAFENGTPNIAILLSPEFRKSKASIWLGIIIVMVAGAAGYFVYRKKV
ncbi:MAG: hypothetical protein A3I44_02195 [Candidatus Sungbacteria bacterium RIFCSPLOWO2_02_FULL_51_17]|nr:MAG: hypothetical protein A2676_04165 [Candidatus Sungbacteria bacterium RIFCSPHIGHO2_01_FULL_51_22]OHA04912.1 MAG: hypothetical protein A3B29_01035 [Candidatus Sungbacteria bacterium RIFCSPLOWO2_01_FULL_51_34]OHA11088.1 MAG: hypothetical protein A3I44_02195 [Candidatus Sungbacteria bacterium RIFCSPLOWO2_02_FULL_51_17]